MKKKALATLMAAAMTVSVLGGCGSDGKDPGSSSASDAGSGSAASGEGNSAEESGSADSSQAEPSADGEVVTLRIVDWESDVMNDAMQDAFDNVFSVAHPNIKVEIVRGSYSDYNQSLRGMITAGEAPDVFQLGYDQACSFYRMNLLTDWAEKVGQEPEFVESFYSGTMQGWQYRGATYGFPSLVNVYGVFYNKDILANVNLEEPATGWTWEDLWSYSEALADSSANKYGIYGLGNSAFDIANISTSAGGAAFIDDITDTSAITVDDKFIEAATKRKELIADGIIPQTSYDGGNQQSMFEAGEVGLYYYGQWEIDNLLRNCPDLNWGYVATPQGSAGATTTYDTVGWVSPRDLAHPEETWELIKFMSGEMYESVLKVTPVAPCAHKDYAHVFYDAVTEAGHPEAAEAVQAMMSVEKKNGVRYAADWAGDASKVWDESYNNFLDSKADTDLKELADKVNEVISANQ